MDRSWWWKFWTVIGVTLLSIWFLLPTYYSFVVLPKPERNNIALLQQRLPKWAPSAEHRLSLGLDLQGGIHMVMQVDTETALRKRVERRGVVVQNYLNDKVGGGVVVKSDPDHLQLDIQLPDASKRAAVEKELGGFDDFQTVKSEGGQIVLQLTDAWANRFKQESVDQAMLVIRKRIDKWGVAEVEVRKVGTDAIQVSLPGQKDPEQAKELIGTTAQLEFRMVDDESQVLAELYRSNPPPADAGITLSSDIGPFLAGKDRASLLAYLATIKDKVPNDRQVMLECVSGSANKEKCDSYRTYLLHKDVPLTGESLASAQARPNQFGEPEVQISFDAQGAREFEALTEKSVGKRMAIVLDENVHSAPRINEKIGGGSAVITMGGRSRIAGQDPMAEANTLALVLKAGALPAPVSVGEIRQVGASLGDELIKKGGLAALVGLALVILFMAFYYRKSGLIADVALLLNGLLILAGLAFFNATLTLPGIAGFVLTLGIAVDANVLINERIREELRHGKTARAAVDQGYDRAFWTIFDAHVTTLIAGFILFFTGTGPVQGFATSLIVGLLASLFTSIVVTRVIVSYFVHGRNAQTVSV